LRAAEEETLVSEPSRHDQWAWFRFSVIGPLLASPPQPGALQEQLVRLSERTWKHPLTGEPLKLAASTIERWYYQARRSDDPVVVLRRKPRKDRGQQSAVSVKLGEVLRRQHREHPTWSYQLHYDNLEPQVSDNPDLGRVPSYASVRRYMIANGLEKKRRRKGREENGPRRLALREKRGFEAEYVNGLWHLDFHHGSRKILTADGKWVKPYLLAIMDDHSRLVCHAQWYLGETAENLVHGLVQAFCKRDLPRALMSDNGSAMIAGETTQGLRRLSIHHDTTLPYSPEQNGKQEVFWAQVEGRLMAMLEGEPELTLALMNKATLAWVEMEYQRKVHSETQQKPLKRWLEGRSTARRCPDLDRLHLDFTVTETRVQRTSDGTISLAGTRFEVPSRFRNLRRVHVRFATWDLRRVWLMDEDAGVVLDRLFPVDKTGNADGHRRPVKAAANPETPPNSGIAPLLRQLMTEYAATGLPPAYILKEDS
jgi:transposase InsO family protein